MWQMLGMSIEVPKLAEQSLIYLKINIKEVIIAEWVVYRNFGMQQNEATIYLAIFPTNVYIVPISIIQH